MDKIFERFERMLREYFEKEHPEVKVQLKDDYSKFIKERVRQGIDEYNQNRGEVGDLIAEIEAKQIMIKGYEISKYSYLKSLVEEEEKFNVLDSGKLKEILIAFILENEQLFNKYNFNNQTRFEYLDEMDNEILKKLNEYEF